MYRYEESQGIKCIHLFFIVDLYTCNFVVKLVWELS